MQDKTIEEKISMNVFDTKSSEDQLKKIIEEQFGKVSEHLLIEGLYCFDEREKCDRKIAAGRIVRNQIWTKSYSEKIKEILDKNKIEYDHKEVEMHLEYSLSLKKPSR